MVRIIDVTKERLLSKSKSQNLMELVNGVFPNEKFCSNVSTNNIKVSKNKCPPPFLEISVIGDIFNLYDEDYSKEVMNLALEYEKKYGASVLIKYDFS